MKTASIITAVMAIICHGSRAATTDNLVPRQDNSTSTGCTRYRVECSPTSPGEFPPIVLPPWDVCVDSCIRDSEKLELQKNEQQCCNECDEQRECCAHCHDPKNYGHQTAFKNRDEEKCKTTKDEIMLGHCEEQRQKARENLESYLHGQQVLAKEA